MNGQQVAWLADGKRLHLNHGPIDLIIEAFGRGLSGSPPMKRQSRVFRQSSKNWSPNLPS